MPNSLQTKTAFANALKELLKTTPFEKITVSSICVQSDMKRTSFYYHFLDKYDLVNWIFDSEFVSFLESKYNVKVTEMTEIPAGVSGWDILLNTAEYFYTHADFYNSVLFFTGQNSFQDHIRELLTPILQTLLRDILKDQKAMDFHVNFYVDALLAALLRWVHDQKRVSPEEYVELLKSCIHVSIVSQENEFWKID